MKQVTQETQLKNGPSAVEHIVISPGEIEQLRELEVLKQRVFSARRVEIMAPEDMNIRIGGIGEQKTSRHIIVANTENPKDLIVKIEADRGQLRGKDDVLYLVKGVLDIAGLKDSKLAKELEGRLNLKELPKPARMEDPDVVILADRGIQFDQVAFVRIKVPSGAKITLI